MAVANVIGSYRAGPTDTYISCQTSFGGVGITLPAITVLQNGFETTVVDVGNNAAVNNITIATADGALINGQSSLVISLSGGAVVLVKNGQSWTAAGEFTPTSQSSPNVAAYWAVQAVTTTAATISPSTTFVGCNFNGTVALTLPPVTNPNVVFGRPLVISNQTNTGNGTTQAIWLVGGNASTSINSSNGAQTISTAFGTLRVVPDKNGWWVV
jgi:hypothetical protein